MESVFLYSDYRKYMSDYFEEMKRESRFSYQAFADSARIKSRGFIFRVIKGDKNLSAESSSRIARAMNLAKKEVEYFQALVRFNQARDNRKKHIYYRDMVEIKRGSRRTPESALLRDDQVELHARWYHAVVRSLVGIIRFTGDYERLGQMVQPNITAFQARKSVELLERLELIRRDADGVYRLQENTVTTGEDFRPMALHHYYSQCYELAERAMSDIPREERSISGLTLGMSRQNFTLVTERIAQLRKELLDLAENDRDSDSVYKINISVFPVSQTVGAEDKGVVHEKN
ncbi:MAG: TIGR02147 family protein [Fibrobacterota bacterium]